MREIELTDRSMRRSTRWVTTPRLAAPCFVGYLSSTFHFVSDLSGWRTGDSSRKGGEIHRERGRELLPYNVLQGSPLVLKLVPAVCIIIFAVWGIGPLLSQSRNILLHKNDSSWKKSRTYHVMTSYLQPLLLWTGATLICRALDPVVLPTEASQVVKQRLLIFVRSLSTVLAFAYCLSSVIQQAQKFFIETNDTGDTRTMGFQFAGRAVYSAVWVAAVSLFMELLGFSTQKWLTAGGLGTVLLTLAGREIFTNFLSSAMIHATRPFVVNEWIQTKIEGYEVSGTVEHVGWWSPTIVRGEDREAVHIPNHKFTVNVNIVADMRKVLAKNPQVEQQRLHRRVFLDNINTENQALLILISCFVKTSHYEEYLCVKEAILLDLLRVISHHRARLATPIRTVQKIYSDADLDNFPSADTIFGRGGVAASNRPLLMIEPPSRINGEDKTKTQNRSVRTSEQDGKTTNTRPAAGIKGDAKVGLTSVSDSKSRGKTTSDSKADTKIGDTPNPDTKEDTKAVAASVSDPKGRETATAKSSKPVPDVKQTKSTSLGSVMQKSDNPSVSSSESSVDKASRIPTTQSRQEGERVPTPVSQPQTSRPVLEDNIVLGVALEGSKRTLPIDEGMVSPPSPAEGKEMAGSHTSEKNKKDGQFPTAPSATSGNQ
uniref:Mechanosensitive ion channel protein n=1 Tax=Fagus sylvatica TaxID=28930 RepID=A0A2N9IYX1_FAGSY